MKKKIFRLISIVLALFLLMSSMAIFVSAATATPVTWSNQKGPTIVSQTTKSANTYKGGFAKNASVTVTSYTDASGTGGGSTVFAVRHGDTGKYLTNGLIQSWKTKSDYTFGLYYNDPYKNGLHDIYLEIKTDHVNAPIYTNGSFYYYYN